MHAERHRRVHRLRADASAARERRRARREGARTVLGRPHPARRPVVTLTILEGSTFCICDDRGDVGDATSGFFAHDTRFLSVLRLTIDGKTPAAALVVEGRVLLGGVLPAQPARPTACRRTRCRSRDAASSARAMQERIVIRNEGMESVSFTLGLEIGCDFADIMSVKDHDFALGDPVNAEPLPPPVDPHYDEANNQFVLADPDGEARDAGDPLAARRAERERDRRTRSSSRRGTRGTSSSTSCRCSTRQELAPRLVERRFGDELVHVRDSLAAWQLRVPQLRAGWDDLEPVVLAVGRRPRRAADAERGGPRPRPAPRRRDAVVHDRLRPRHDHHVPPDAALRPGARTNRARGARRAAGDGGRPVDRRGAGEDRPRGAHRQGGEALVPLVLRHGRRDAALPRAALRGLALDGRHARS